jgi:hypothetical protein
MKGASMPYAFLSTYARLFIGFNEAMSRLIKKHSRQSQSRHTQILPITILSPDQVKSLSHPHNESLKDFIRGAYADFMKANRMLIKGQESLEEQYVFIDETIKTFDEKKRSASPATKKTIEKTQAALNGEYVPLTNIKNMQNHSRRELATLAQDFSNFITELDTEWSQYRDKMLKQLRDELAKVLKEAGLPPLPQGEIENLLRQDLQDLDDRFEDLGASKDLPDNKVEKLLGLNKPDIDTYFKKKAYLALRSVDPSRENIDQYLRQLNNFFKAAKTEGKQLLTKQEAKIKALGNEKVKPIVQSLESNNKTLDKLKEYRDDSIKTVASIRDIEAIRNKTVQRISEARPIAPSVSQGKRI